MTQALCTITSGGEDGAVKTWSRNGMLRFALVITAITAAVSYSLQKRTLFQAQTAHPVYAVDWNADSTKVCYCSSEDCFIKLLKAQVWDWCFHHS